MPTDGCGQTDATPTLIGHEGKQGQTERRSYDFNKILTSEQRRFLDTLSHICSREASFKIPKNPISDLRDVFDSWHAGTRRYLPKFRDTDTTCARTLPR